MLLWDMRESLRRRTTYYRSIRSTNAVQRSTGTNQTSAFSSLTSTTADTFFERKSGKRRLAQTRRTVPEHAHAEATTVALAQQIQRGRGRARRRSKQRTWSTRKRLADKNDGRSVNLIDSLPPAGQPPYACGPLNTYFTCKVQDTEAGRLGRGRRITPPRWECLDLAEGDGNHEYQGGQFVSLRKQTVSCKNQYYS